MFSPAHSHSKENYCAVCVRGHSSTLQAEHRAQLVTNAEFSGQNHVPDYHHVFLKLSILLQST